MDRKKIGIFASLFILFLCGLFLVFYFIQKPGTAVNKKQPLTIEDGVDINEENDEEDDYTEIPVYKSITVSSKNPNVYFGNPEINHVYFRYKVYLKTDGNEGEETVLYDNDAVIKPGRAFEINLRKLLEPGKYKVIVDISTYDLETQTQCNGATQEAVLTVLN